MIKEIKLDWLRAQTQAIVPEDTLVNIEVSQYPDYLGNIILKMASDIVTYTHNPSLEHDEVFHTTVTRPRFANPWEHFKARYAGRSWFRWYVKRHPIKFTQEKYFISLNVKSNFKEVVTFPDSKIKFPKELGNPTVAIQINERSIEWNSSVDNPLTTRYDL